MTRPPWDFAYEPLPRPTACGHGEQDLVVATERPASPTSLTRALAEAGIETRVETLLERAPLHWYRVRRGAPGGTREISEALQAFGIRYVTSSFRSAPTVSGPLEPWPPSPAPSGWEPRASRPCVEDTSGGQWFLDDVTGVSVDRGVCGTGAGTRLAVIDDDASEAETLELDSEILIGIDAPPRASSHGAAMVAWAAGTGGDSSRYLRPFSGVAPDASPRLYCIPKAGQELFWLPLALVRAVDDGADVVVCATYVEGTTSPLLDDALELAARAGRCGRGTAVILPTGREISSPEGSVHASLSLALDDPGSDPRVLCVAPSGRSGGWFLFRDRRGLLRPFANRGPAVRVAAPGDDITYPFTPDGRLGHAESSGASAIAAGVALLVLATNPELSAEELYTILTRTVVPATTMPEGPLGDAADLLPSGRDPDGHEARTGHGRLSARRACLVAADPLLATLLGMGEESAARRLHVLLRGSGADGGGEPGQGLPYSYSPRLGRVAARALLSDDALRHELAVIVRHVRLVVGHPERVSASAPEALLRGLALTLRRLVRVAPSASNEERRLLRDLLRACENAEVARALHTAILRVATEVWPRELASGVNFAAPAGDLQRSA